MPTDAFPLDSVMLPPLVLRPPHGPRIVRALVLALAAIFHLVTAGWNLISNGPEGDLAGAARSLLLEKRWFPISWSGPYGGAPLAIWLSRISMSHFGASEFAARLPIALAAIAMVWFTIRIAERSGGIWRGFLAGMILLCSPGMFTMARTLTPAPLATAFITAAFYCLASGAKRRRGRRQWYLLAWFAVAFSYFAGGWRAAAVPVGAVLLLVVSLRKGRLRFAALLSWEGFAIAALTAAGVYLFAILNSGQTDLGFGWTPPTEVACGMAGWKSACWMLGILFPWSILLIPAVNTSFLRLARLRPLDWAEAFPVAWIAVGLSVALTSSAGPLVNMIAIWPAIAVWGALRLETLPRASLLRAAGAVLGLAAVALALTGRLRHVLGGACHDRAAAIQEIPAFFWSSVTSVAFIAVLAFGLFAACAFWLEWQNRRRFALLAFFWAMIPAGYAFEDASAKFAPYFSYADLAHCINASRGAKPRVMVDGSRMDASSLRFYLDGPLQPFESVKPDDRQMVSKLLSAAGDRVFIITQRERLHLWRAVPGGDRLRIACESGGNLLLTNSAENDAVME